MLAPFDGGKGLSTQENPSILASTHDVDDCLEIMKGAQTDIDRRAGPLMQINFATTKIPKEVSLSPSYAPLLAFPSRQIEAHKFL